MKKWIPAAGSVLLTLLAVVIAVVVSLHLWDYYMEAPGPATATCTPTSFRSHRMFPGW